MTRLTVDSEPFVQILPFRQHDSNSKISRPERRFGVFLQLILLRSFRSSLVCAVIQSAECTVGKLVDSLVSASLLRGALRCVREVSVYVREEGERRKYRLPKNDMSAQNKQRNSKSTTSSQFARAASHSNMRYNAFDTKHSMQTQRKKNNPT